SRLPANQFRLCHLLNGVLWSFPARAAELYPAVGHLIHAELWYLVDHKASYVNPLGCPEGLLNIACVDAGLQSVFGIVDLGNGVFQRVVGVDPHYWPERLATGDLGVRWNIRQDRRLDGRPVSHSATHQLGPGIDRFVNPILDPLRLALSN